MVGQTAWHRAMASSSAEAESEDMGFVNPRAFCPNCGAKIHTHTHGALQITYTGRQCPYCHIPLTGKVGHGNKAIAEAIGPNGEIVGEDQLRAQELTERRS